ISDDDDLTWPGQRINIYHAVNQLLRCRDILIAWADDLIHARYRLSAVGERGHGLRAADSVDLEQFKLLKHRRNHRAFGKLRGRRDDHDAAYARDLRRHSIHHHRRRISRAAAGHVEADDVERA